MTIDKKTRKEFIPKDIYTEIVDRMPITTVDVLFFTPDKKSVLLFKRTNEPLKDLFFSVGGRLYKNETFLECAIRQVCSEVGIEVDKDKLILGGVQDEIFPNSAFDDISYHAVNIFFGYILNGEEIKLDAQHSEYTWFDIEDETIHPLIKSKMKETLAKT